MKFSDEIIKELGNLSILNNYRGIIALICDWFVILVAATLSVYANNFFIYIFSIFLIGTRQRALATILHESAHRVLARNVSLNDFLGKYFSGYTIFQTFRKYAKSHVVLHHNFLGEEKKDPDYKYYLESKLFEESSKNKFIIKNLISPLLLSKTPSFIKYLINNRIGDLKDPELVRVALLWLFVISSFIYMGYIKLLLLYWIIPLVTTFPMVGWFIEMAEHFPIIENSDDIDKTWNRFSSKLELFFTGMHSENFHLTHHLMPNIPFWNLHKAHEVMMKDQRYRDRNEKMGGIFLSAKGRESLWSKIFKGYLINSKKIKVSNESW